MDYDQARDAYLAEHPAPQPTWFTCPRCKAGPGEPCQNRRRPGSAHAPRQDVSITAFRLRSLDAANHADGTPTDHHIRYMRRVHARPATTKEH